MARYECVYDYLILSSSTFEVIIYILDNCAMREKRMNTQIYTFESNMTYVIKITFYLEIANV